MEGSTVIVVARVALVIVVVLVIMARGNGGKYSNRSS